MMPNETPGQRLWTKLELAAPAFAGAAERLWTSPRVRELYPVYLATMHMIVRAAVPVLQAARERARAKSGHDPLSAQLVEFLSHYMREEAGHDDDLLADLAATGADPTIPLEANPSPNVASLVGAQYYWIFHHHPVAVLGHVAALVSFPPPPGFAAQLQARTGLSEAAFETLARHELGDPARRAEFYATFDELPLTRRQETLIGLSALHTMDAGSQVLGEIYERVVLRMINC